MKQYPSLEELLTNAAPALAKGPIALILMEDDVEADSTVRHCLSSGFRSVVAFGVSDIILANDLPDTVHRVVYDMSQSNALTDVVNAMIEKAPAQWIYYGYNSEYIFFPFCENRAIGEMLSFHTEERRDAVLTYVVDLYAGDLDAHPNAVSLDDAYMDKSGYYALARKDKENNFAERQLDFFGGLRWRFEEHVPMPRRRIDRISIFRAKPGLRLNPDHTFNDQEYNTYACPWHHSITAALCSFRTAKALKRNPVSAAQIKTFRWHNSAPFEWHSQQLLDLGLMEPGQWF
ncbi:MAG: hypothetical protein KC439_08685 [Yoonia sp.]|mgnify:FL=1|nr:hypothetical protein [Yoonia sp.]